MRGRKGGRGLYRQTETNVTTQRSPTGDDTYGDRGPIVVSGRESRLHGEGGQNTGFEKTRGFRMEDKALIRLEAIRRRNAERTWINSDLYRLLYKPDLYELVYERIKSNPGNMTAGVDDTTLDGFSFQFIEGIVHRLQDESFQFKPAKRILIPKANGKKRPLGIPPPTDKVVQGVIHLILEAIYDSPYGAYFHDCSHGFRPGRSCHTALRTFRDEWKGTTWIIEGDIKACFDEIDQKILLDLLRRKIADGRFLNLIGKSLKAGYLLGSECHKPVVGSPQGSTLSPILANIYLHELDDFVLNLKKKWETGKCRKPNPEYNRLSLRRRRLLRKLGGEWTDEIVELTKQLRTLPSLDTHDPEYIRIKYRNRPAVFAAVRRAA
jgi:retron-type reverse transcriptase